MLRCIKLRKRKLYLQEILSLLPSPQFQGVDVLAYGFWYPWRNSKRKCHIWNLLIAYRLVIVCCEVFLRLPLNHVAMAAVEDRIGDGQLALSCVAIHISWGDYADSSAHKSRCSSGFWNKDKTELSFGLKRWFSQTWRCWEAVAATFGAWARELLCWLVLAQPFQAKHLKNQLFGFCLVFFFLSFSLLPDFDSWFYFYFFISFIYLRWRWLLCENLIWGLWAGFDGK